MIADKMPEKKIWVVNKGEPLDHINLTLKKHIYLKKDVPLQFPLNIALNYVNKFKNVQFCKNPEDYFKNRKLKRLILRDAGIGDLLMLEPILRKMSEDDRFRVDIACMYPEVFDNHPNVNKVVKMSGKENINELDLKSYDCWEDLRNFSETHNLRDKEHRTDIYNQPFKLDLSDEEKEPRIYFKKGEKSILKKKKSFIYVGIQCDASHKYRRYDRGKELINYLLKKNKRIIAVLMGHYEFIKNVSDKRIINLQGKTNRREAINVIKDLDYLIAADSGLLHVALSMHVPTVAMFSIITPHFRLKYYRGEKRVIWKDLDCRGCGDWHMVKCRHVGKHSSDVDYLAPCMNIEPEEIYNNMMEMPINNKRRLFYGDNIVKQEDITKKEINIIPTPTKSNKTLTMPIILLNEEKNLPRFIELVINHPNIGRVIAIDGGSTDKSVELLKKAGAEVYVHPYLKEYHEMQAMQRNISCSYLKDGERAIIMDLDECFSKDLSDYLPLLAESGPEYGLISRRTFEYYKDITFPEKQIKDYPDYQPRFYTWNRKYKFVGGAHHQTINVPEPMMIDKDIIHFEREGKDREAMEKQWATMMSGVRQYA
jgi:ADP-heptose:LPS heptosyltransferase